MKTSGYSPFLFGNSNRSMQKRMSFVSSLAREAGDDGGEAEDDVGHAVDAGLLRRRLRDGRRPEARQRHRRPALVREGATVRPEERERARQRERAERELRRAAPHLARREEH